jgi:hypothetical protein
MPYKRFKFLLLFSGLILVVTGLSLLLNPAQPVEAQCGSSASSCQSCHEVQGALPVNADGTSWHEAHAFGDFCYICHAGNQQALDKESAHVGMVPPLSDVNASCQMCHADDLNERAAVYASILGVDLASGSGDSGSVSPTSEPSDDDFWASDSVATSVPAEATAPVAAVDTGLPASNELIVDDASVVDYVQRYNEIVLGERPVNWGNVALGAMIGLLVIGGTGFVVVNELRVNTARGETRKAEGEYPVDVVEMLPALSALKSKTRRALTKILANPQKTDKVLGLIDTVISDEETEEHS